MFDWLQFEKHEGTWKKKDLVVLALSTCGFCKRGMEYLNARDIDYKYVYLDNLSKEERKKVSEEFRDNFKQRSLFPALIIDNTDFQLGFIEKAWDRSLGL